METTPDAATLASETREVLPMLAETLDSLAALAVRSPDDAADAVATLAAMADDCLSLAAALTRGTTAARVMAAREACRAMPFGASWPWGITFDDVRPQTGARRAA